MHRAHAWLLAAALAAAALPSLARAEDAPKAAPKPKALSVGEPAPALAATTLDGAAWSLADARKVAKEDAWAAVAKAAQALGATDPKPEQELASIAGLKEGDAVDPLKRAELARAAGSPWSLAATPDSTAEWKTLGEVAAWVEGAATAPIVLVCWSSDCPSCRLVEERMVEAAAATGARVYLLVCNYNDEDDAVKERLADAGLPFKALLDRDQKITDLLGGKKTPHFFVFDARNTLRYAGALDNDPAMTEPDSNRTSWLRDALAALAQGRAFDVWMTAPKG